MGINELTFGQEIIRARFPWVDNAKGIVDGCKASFNKEERREISICLNCKKSECDNCMENPAMGRPQKASVSDLQKLLDKKMSTKAICDALGISRTTFFEYKKKLKGEIK